MAASRKKYITMEQAFRLNNYYGQMFDSMMLQIDGHGMTQAEKIEECQRRLRLTVNSINPTKILLNDGSRVPLETDEQGKTYFVIPENYGKTRQINDSQNTSGVVLNSNLFIKYYEDMQQPNKPLSKLKVLLTMPIGQYSDSILDRIGKSNNWDMTRKHRLIHFHRNRQVINSIKFITITTLYELCHSYEFQNITMHKALRSRMIDGYKLGMTKEKMECLLNRSMYHKLIDKLTKIHKYHKKQIAYIMQLTSKF
jgi:hypothetical protein